MKIKSNWTQEEDQFVKSHALLEKRKNWVKVSQLLNQNFPEKHRTSKQCRERYINYSRMEQKTSTLNDWTDEQMEFLLKIFEKQGPKWTKISKIFPERTQNQVKNKFYCLLRKFVRKMNYMGNNISDKLKKQIKYKSVFRILNSQWSLTTLPQNLREKAKQIRSKILNSVLHDIKIQSSLNIEQIIESINHFNLQTRSYRSIRPKRFQIKKQESKQLQEFSKQLTKQMNKQRLQKNFINNYKQNQLIKNQQDERYFIQQQNQLTQNQKFQQKKQNILSQEQIAEVIQNQQNKKKQTNFPESLLDEQIQSPLDRYFLL